MTNGRNFKPLLMLSGKKLNEVILILVETEWLGFLTTLNTIDPRKNDKLNAKEERLAKKHSRKQEKLAKMRENPHRAVGKQLAANTAISAGVTIAGQVLYSLGKAKYNSLGGKGTALDVAIVNGLGKSGKFLRDYGALFTMGNILAVPGVMLSAPLSVSNYTNKQKDRMRSEKTSLKREKQRIEKELNGIEKNKK